MSSESEALQEVLEQSGVEFDIGVSDGLQERAYFHNTLTELNNCHDSDERKKLLAKVKNARNEYSLVFHKWFAKQYPHLLYERGEDKTFWYYDTNEGVYVEMGRSEVRGLLMHELSKENMRDFTKESYCRDCLARYRGEYFERSRSYEDFDTDDTWFHANNGWVHLEDLTFEPHTPKRNSRRKSAVDYNKDAMCPRYDKFIGEDCLLKKDAVRVIDQFSGLLLTHDVKYQKMLTLIGKAGSGKSTLLELWSHVFGDMVSQNSLTDFSGDKHRFIGSSLVGRTLCWCDEVEVKRPELSSALEKKITGTQIEIERKGIDGTRYAPNYLKFVLTANALPASSEVGMYRRLIVIPFIRSFTTEGCAELDILTTLRGEASGVLNRMLKGLRDIRKMKGFTMIEGHDEHIEEYKTISNTVSGFLDEYFVPVFTWNDGHYKIPTKDLFDAYCQYGTGVKYTLTPQRFGQMMKEQPLERFQHIEPSRGTKGVRTWKGMELRNGYEWSDGCIVSVNTDNDKTIKPDDIPF